MKEARDEAKNEIAEYKAKKEDEYKKFEAEVQPTPESWTSQELIRLDYSTARGTNKQRMKPTRRPRSRFSLSRRLARRARLVLLRTSSQPFSRPIASRRVPKGGAYS